MKILVVDDVGYARHFHTRLLQKAGHGAVAAASGAEAIKMLKTDHSIDLVLTDLAMQDMDGIELYQQVQRLERMNDAGPVDPPLFVLMTALHPGKNAQPRDIERIQLAKQLGISEVLFKPIEQETLLALINNLKSGRKAPKVNVQALISQVNGAIETLLEGGTPDDVNAFLNAVEPGMTKIQEAALVAATA